MTQRALNMLPKRSCEASKRSTDPLFAFWVRHEVLGRGLQGQAIQQLLFACHVFERRSLSSTPPMEVKPRRFTKVLASAVFECNALAETEQGPISVPADCSLPQRQRAQPRILLEPRRASSFKMTLKDPTTSSILAHFLASHATISVAGTPP